MSFGYGVGDFLSILQLADELKKRFAQAPSEFKAISHEFKHLWTILHDLDDVPDAGLSEYHEKELRLMVHEARMVLLELKAKLDKCRVLAYSTSDWKLKARQAWSKITWDQAEINGFRARLTSIASQLTLLMGKLNQDLALEIRDGVQSLNERQTHELRDTILAWLSPRSPAQQQSEAFNSRQPGTGRWFLVKKEFCHWMETEKQTLFCPGIPGAGKTVLTSIVVDHLERTFAGRDDVGIAYLYCSFQQQQTLSVLLSSLLRQLAQSRPWVPEPIQRLYQQHQIKGDRPSVDEIQRVILEVAAGYERGFFVVDALDECPDSTGVRRQFLNFLRKLQSQTNVNLLVTSRPSEDIESFFTQNTISLKIEARNADVELYINNRMDEMPAFVHRRPDLGLYIRDEIVKSTKGMFLLARLYFSLLLHERNEKRMRTVASNFISGFDAVDFSYNETMQRVEQQSPSSRDLAKAVLGWLTYSMRPLTIMELQHAVAVEQGTTEFDDTNVTDIEEVTAVCGGLIVVDKQSQTVRLVHYTTQEYFGRTWQRWFPDIHRLIVDSCLTYVSYDVFEEECNLENAGRAETLERFPFYTYAAEYWGRHFQRQPGDMSLCLSFLRNTSKVCTCAQGIFGIPPADSASYGGKSSTLPHVWMKGVHLASYFGLTDVVEELLRSDADDVHAEDHLGRTPLGWAAAYGHDALVHLLLNKCVQVDLVNMAGYTPLFYAAVYGHTEVVRCLLDRGANANLEDRDGAGPLFHAAKGGQRIAHFSVVDYRPDSDTGNYAMIIQLLIDRGAAVNHANRDGGTPLIAAAENGQHDLALLLLERGADVNSVCLNGSSPLVVAARNGHVAVVQMLVERGAACSTPGQCGDQPSPYYMMLALLVDAGMRGQDQEFRSLIAQGANATDQDEHGRLPIHWAAHRGQQALLQCLIDTGSDVNARDIFGRTPLLTAISSNRIHIVQQLLKCPEVDAQGADQLGVTPLVESDRRGFHAISRMIRQHNGEMVPSVPKVAPASLRQVPMPQSLLVPSCSICLVKSRHVDTYTCTNCSHVAGMNGHSPAKSLIICSTCLPHTLSCPNCHHELEAQEARGPVRSELQVMQDNNKQKFRMDRAERYRLSFSQRESNQPVLLNPVTTESYRPSPSQHQMNQQALQYPVTAEGHRLSPSQLRLQQQALLDLVAAQRYHAGM